MHYILLQEIQTTLQTLDFSKGDRFVTVFPGTKHTNFKMWHQTYAIVIEKRFTVTS
jgi:hypothetical protein